jgi:hypothetical protein
MVSTPTLAVELQKQLLTRERELVSRELTIAPWDDGTVAFEHTLGGCA